MANLDKDINVTEKEGQETAMPVGASAKLFKGALVIVNAAGFVVRGAPATGTTFAGINLAHVDNTDGADGAVKARVRHVGSHELSGTGFAAADLGKQVYLLDDQTVTVAEGTAFRQKVGKIIEVLSATKVMVKFEAFQGVGAGA